MAVAPPRRAIWDLEHLASLSTAPGLLLIVSERSSYVLHNLVSLDVWDNWRYALQPPEDGIYSPVIDEESPEWSLFLEVAEDCQTQLIEVGTVPISTTLYAESYSFSLSNQGPGNVVVEGPLVPAGEVWLVENFWVWLSAATTGRFIFGFSGDQTTWLYRAATMAVGYSAQTFLASLGYNARAVWDFDGVPAATSIQGGFNYRAIPVE